MHLCFKFCLYFHLTKGEEVIATNLNQSNDITSCLGNTLLGRRLLTELTFSGAL